MVESVLLFALVFSRGYAKKGGLISKVGLLFPIILVNVYKMFAVFLHD